MTYDLIVIGGGPAGYVGAIRAAQLGKSVVCIEREKAGGTCLNWGCIPTKALLKNAEVYTTLNKRAKEFGLSFENLSFDWSSVVSRSRKISDRLAGGIGFLFRKNKITFVNGEACLKSATQVEVTSSTGEKTLVEGANILICTGCKSRELPSLPFDGKRVIGSRDALCMEQRPESMIVIGAGAIGVEFSSVYNSFGTKVTIVEMQKTLLPVEDEEIGAALGKLLGRQGIRCLTDTKMTGAKTTDTGVEITVETPKGQEVLTADVCLVAIGVQPIMIPGDISPELTDRGYIKVNDRYETSIPGVYAAGDIIGPPWLAHVASFEATQAVEGLFKDGSTPRQVGNFPGCTYCHPQVASVGKTEQALKDAGVEYTVGRFPFQAIGKAVAAGETDGFVKLLFGKENGEILGAHILGDNATELIGELGLGMEMEATDEDIHSTIHAHPTLSEAIHEATLDAHGQAIHF